MTITTGTIFLKGTTNSSSIKYEITGNASGTVSLRDMSDFADPSVGTLPTGMRDFAGHTQGGIPSQPIKCTVIQESFLGMKCSWFDTSSDETGFKIQWSINGGAFGNEQTVGANVTQVYFACTQGDTHRARVASYNGSGQSAWCTTSFPGPVGDFDCFI
jgi:hypothetical protein